MQIWMSPKKIWGLQWKNWDLQLEYAVTNDKIGVSNEEMESPMKIWASPKKNI